MLGVLGVLAALGVLAPGAWVAFWVALGLVTIGLMASTFHLGRPERAWRALSQWRTSWLSREGIAALIAYPPAVALGGWLTFGEPGGWAVPLGGLTAVTAGATVFATGMLYRSLPPIRAWANGFTVPGYLLMALASGLPMVMALLVGQTGEVVALLAAGTAVAALQLKRAYWRWLDDGQAATTAGTATGLGHLGRVRMLDPPHTGTNFLMKEMGYRVARKHGRRLRGVAVGLIGVSGALALGSAVLPWLAVLAGPVAVLGVAVERWLFFAEAKHTTMLYYGAETA